MVIRIRLSSAWRRDRSGMAMVMLACWFVGIGLLSTPAIQAGGARSADDDWYKPSDEMREFEETSDEETSDEEETPVVKPVSQLQAPEELPPEPELEPRDSPSLNSSSLSSPDRVLANGFGTLGRASFLGGKTFGRTDSIIPLEYFPYLLSDESLIFGDLRGFMTTGGQPGGNFGLGYRRLFPDRNAWAGGSFWYDADQSTSKMFQQVGLSFEALVRQFEARANVYIPVTSSQTFSNAIVGSSFVGNQLLFNRSIDIGQALTGFDAELGYSWSIQDRHVVRAFAGGYYFNGGSTGGVPGGKVRLEGVINNAVMAHALYTNDPLYGSNLMLGVSLQLPFGKNHPTAGWNRNTPSPFRFVERNYNVAVAHDVNNSFNQVAINPATGQPFVVDQVGNPSGGTPDGTTANPFGSVAAAQSAGGDVIVVQSGTVLNEAVTLTPGQYLFGQGGGAEFLSIPGGGLVPIPTAAGGGATPMFQNVAGDAITLASNTEVAGFIIDGPAGNGISGTGVSGVSLHDLIFSSSGGDAINLANSSGSVSLRNIQINSATGNGIVFNGGAPNLSFFGAGSTITTQGDGFVLANLSGGNIALHNLSLSNTVGTGLVIDSVQTDVVIDSLMVSQSGAGAAAVEVTGTTGTSRTANFTGTTTIMSPNGTGFSVDNTDSNVNVANLNVTSSASSPAVSVTNAAGGVLLTKVGINTQNATGLFANNAANLVVGGGNITTVNATAMDVASSGIHSQLDGISVNGGAYGIRLDNSTGNFVIKGVGFGSSGTIQNTTTAGISINSFDSLTLSGLNFINNAVGIQTTDVAQIDFSKLTFTGSAGYAIDALNAPSFSLANSVFQGNGAAGGGTIRYQADTLGTYIAYISGNTITDPNGSAIQFLTQPGGEGSALTTTVASNTITGYGTGGSLIGANWNGTVTASVGSNTLYAYGSGMTAIGLADPTLTNIFTASVASNIITFETAAATGGTGIWLVAGQSGQTSTAAASPISVASNSIYFQGTGGTGMRFGLYAPVSTSIGSNGVDDEAGGATGMLFDNIADNTNAMIVGNYITLLAGDTTTHRGIIFSQVGSNFNLITPTATATTGSTTSNWVYNAVTAQDAFSIPAGTGAGGILINNLYLTAPNW